MSPSLAEPRHLARNRIVSINPRRRDLIRFFLLLPRISQQLFSHTGMLANFGGKVAMKRIE